MDSRQPQRRWLLSVWRRNIRLSPVFRIDGRSTEEDGTGAGSRKHHTRINRRHYARADHDSCAAWNKVFSGRAERWRNRLRQKRRRRPRHRVSLEREEGTAWLGPLAVLVARWKACCLSPATQPERPRVERGVEP